MNQQIESPQQVFVQDACLKTKVPLLEKSFSQQHVARHSWPLYPTSHQHVLAGLVRHEITRCPIGIHLTIAANHTVCTCLSLHTDQLAETVFSNGIVAIEEKHEVASSYAHSKITTGGES